jgi:hypothetical protein
MTVAGHYWDDGVYAGIRTFHEEKGFDPDSLDVAHRLGYPLYQIACEFEPPFRHGEA